jgi:uncharacterized membrane protein YkgB
MQEDPIKIQKTETTVEPVQRVQPVEKDNQNYTISKVVQVIQYIAGLLIALLAIRFVLALLGANLANQFANFIYTVTDPMVAPFRGLLQVSQFQAGVSRFEIETLLTIAIYALVTWGITRLILLARK